MLAIEEEGKVQLLKIRLWKKKLSRIDREKLFFLVWTLSQYLEHDASVSTIKGGDIYWSLPPRFFWGHTSEDIEEYKESHSLLKTTLLWTYGIERENLVQEWSGEEGENEEDLQKDQTPYSFP